MVHIRKLGELSPYFNSYSLRETTFRLYTCPVPELNWSMFDDTLSGLNRASFKILLISFQILNLTGLLYLVGSLDLWHL